MEKYDPTIAPDPVEWLELDEQERVDMAVTYHEAAKIKLPNVTLHAVVHVVVENQIAEGLQSTVRAMERLVVKDRLSRHDALHAIGSVVSEHMVAAMKTTDSNYASTAQARYDTAVDRLTAKKWKRLYG
ncbi:MAG: hypothetical protein A2075_03860 [Geobacteraceae bacterium GWC2_58_44]|nr:MAG: hypothetical protein A2075_03860 [Geobacteraceae bacterium GWC2_58_44]HBG07531.1 hypothetical protein [Geobacter sp.]